MYEICTSNTGSYWDIGGNVGKYTTHGAYEIAMIANASVTTIYQQGLLSDDPSKFRASQVREFSTEIL